MKPGASIIYSYGKAPRGPPGLMFPFDKVITVNNTIAFTTYALSSVLGFNPGILERKLAIEILLHHPS